MSNERVEKRGRLRSPRDISPENRLLLLAFPGAEVFKIREGVYRQLGFEGANHLGRSVEWEKNDEHRARVTLAVVVSQQLPYDQAVKFREDSQLWERAFQNRTRIVFAATMSFVNLALRTGQYDKSFFYKTIDTLSNGDEKLKPQRKEHQNPPETEKELLEKLQKAQKLSDEDPTQIVLWENEGLQVLPNDIFDYLVAFIPTIRYGVLLDYEERLRKKGLVRIEGKKDWHKPVEPNVQSMGFLLHRKREDKRTVIKVQTAETVVYATSDPKDAFITKIFEPSIYDKDFSYSRTMKYWGKEFEETVKEKGEKLEDAKKSYESSWGWIVGAKRIKNTKFNEQKARALLDEKYPSKSGLLEQACIALYGQMETGVFDKEREILGLRLLEKGHIIFREPVFSRASRIENERARDLQKVRRSQRKKDEFKPQREALGHNQGKEQLVVGNYTKMVTRWMGEFLNIVGDKSDLYRKFADLHESNVLSLGLQDGSKHRKMTKKTESFYREILDENKNSGNLNRDVLEVLYDLAINALRNPYADEKPSSEIVGFELLKLCFEKAGMDPSDPINYKGFFARVLIEEYIRKWIQNKPKGQTAPLIRSIVYTIMQILAAEKERKEITTPARIMRETVIDEADYYNNVPE